MRLLLIILLFSMVGCLDEPEAPPLVSKANGPVFPAYSPDSFRRDVSLLISSKRYSDASAYLQTADTRQLAEHDKVGYCAVGEDMIVISGVDPAIEFDPNRDWEFPGTSDAVEDLAWQRAATSFAARYNGYRLGK